MRQAPWEVMPEEFRASYVGGKEAFDRDAQQRYAEWAGTSGDGRSGMMFGSKPNPLDQGKYVGNPNHGGMQATPYGGSKSQFTLDDNADFAPVPDFNMSPAVQPDDSPMWAGAPNAPWADKQGTSKLGYGNPTKGIGQMNNGLIQMTENHTVADGNAGHMFNPETGQITQALGGKNSYGKAPNVWNVGDDGYQQLVDNYQQNNPQGAQLSPVANVGNNAEGFNMSPAVQPDEYISPFAGIPQWQGFQTQQQQQPTYNQPATDGSTQGMPNLGYAQQQISGAQPAGLEKQNLDYAMAQLGMMTGGSGSNGGDTGYNPTTPGFDAPWGGASADGGYSNPFTGSDSAGRSQDDPYYGGDSDFGTYGGGGLSSDYGLSNSWSQWGRDAAGMLPGVWGTAGQMFGDAAMGLNPMPGAGNYIPGTDTYMQDYNVNYEGPGDVTTDMYGLGVSEQRDMLIDQGRMGEGMFFGKSVDADQQFFGSQQEALNWMNNDVNVADPTGQFAAEAVSVANDFTPVQDSSFGSQAEAQAVANHGFGSDEHMAALEADGNQPAIDALKSPTAPGVPAPDTGSSDGGWGDTDTSEGTTAGDYSEAGFSQEDADFAQSFDGDSSDDSSSDDGGYGDDSDDGGEGWGSEDATDDNDDGGWGDWGGDDSEGAE